MRLKLDENLPSDLADNLSSRGHDVDTVADEGLSGEDDATVLTAAIQNERLIMTLDRGFGDVRIHPPGSHPGIVVLRPVNQDPLSIVIERSQGAPDETWKLHDVERFVGNRPLACIDDDLWGNAFAWADQRDAPTLLIRTSSSVGLTEQDVWRLEAFGHAVADPDD